MVAVIISLSISAARGEEFMFNASSNAHFSTGLHGMMHPMQINSSEYKSRLMDNMALLSSMGMAENQSFINSGCSTSIIHDRTLLRNICPLPQPVLVAGFGAFGAVNLPRTSHHR